MTTKPGPERNFGPGRCLDRLSTIPVGEYTDHGIILVHSKPGYDQKIRRV